MTDDQRRAEQVRAEFEAECRKQMGYFCGPFTWREGLQGYEDQEVDRRWRLYLAAAERYGSGEDRRDKERIDLMEWHWVDGIHVEACGATPGGNAESRKTATVYIGVGDSTVFRGKTVREALDAAIAREKDRP